MLLTLHMLASAAALGLKTTIKVGIMGEELPGASSGTSGSAERRKVGDGPGRPLYQFNTIEMPIDRTGRHCISVRMDKQTHSLSIDPQQAGSGAVAWGCYNDSIAETGWASLEVGTVLDGDVPLAVKAYSAGVVEGLLTAKRIGEFHTNFAQLFESDTQGGAVATVVGRIVRMALFAWEEFAGGDAGVEPQDDIPRQAWAALIQMRGIRDGNNFAAQTPSLGAQGSAAILSAYQMMVLNMHAEIPAITEVYGRSEQAKLLDPLLQTGRNNTWFRWAAHAPHGSAIVSRVGPLGKPEDIITGHVSFGDYAEMTRIMKTYRFDFGTLVNDVTMSSYPGCVSSTDDYFITGNGLVAMSTSLFVPSSGPSSMPASSNEGLPTFLRALMATRLAVVPRNWAKLYGYILGIASAKQWLIVDYNNFKDGQLIANDTVWMLESLASDQRANDVTHILRDSGFVEIHGVPHFRDIRLLYGLQAEGPGKYEEMRQSALIDKGSTISNLASARMMLTEAATSRLEQLPISARYDIDPVRPVPHGGIDAKVTNKCLVRKLAMQAKSGPPPLPGGRSTPNQNFSWTSPDGIELFPGYSHAGLPNLWDFPWVNAFPGQLFHPIVPTMAECAPDTPR